MMIQVPKLEENRIYHEYEVSQYIGTQSGSSNFKIASLRFPKDFQNDPPEHDGEAWKDGEEILLQYKIFAFANFKEQIKSLESDYLKKSEHSQRVECIVNLLKNGNVFFPVLIHKNDPKCRIDEGHHRSIALLWLESDLLPAFLMGYEDWFKKDN